VLIMKVSSSILLPVVLAVFCCSTVHSLSVKLPHEKAGILGQEEIGPIDNFTCTEEGLFPHDDCEYYITCWDKRAVLWKCTEEMFFDLRYNGCDYAENVDCGSRSRNPEYPGTRTPPTTSTTSDPSQPSTTAGPTTPPPNGTFECTENGAFPHAERCEYFWNCWEGDANLMHCQNDWLFDLTYDGCNFPEMVDCGSRQRPPDSSTVQPPTTSQTQTAPGSTNSDAPSSPSSSSGSSQATDGTSTSGVTGTTRNPGDFQCPRPEGLFPDPDDCSAFYSCIENIPIRNVCPDGLHFNPKTGLCDWPEEAGCSTH